MAMMSFLMLSVLFILAQSIERVFSQEEQCARFPIIFGPNLE
jgi:hypothetical protein